MLILIALCSRCGLTIQCGRCVVPEVMSTSLCQAPQAMPKCSICILSTPLKIHLRGLAMLLGLQHRNRGLFQCN
ncbi:hypothetical protein B0T16DRAFT_399536 [Cercophora newfieldiana]|uniref:Secreted protein n=1 Tax=Cercophora newfieldiana TaxID=92897 RepID=A0AA39YPV6_9PEZI|nr:hypothetical protein B0T16DRAFT_399536 [Cercophora newfieldiana]